MSKRRKAGKKTTARGKRVWAVCRDGHPGLVVLKDRPPVYGGSCLELVGGEYDVRVGLQRGMPRTDRSWPWVAGHEVEFPIANGRAPSNSRLFERLVYWLLERVEDGLRVHVGCIGGHGRTGLLLSALVAQGLGRRDAIQHVRQHYCRKAVETPAQVDFLVERYGVDEAETTYSGEAGGPWGGSLLDPDEPFFEYEDLGEEDDL